MAFPEVSTSKPKSITQDATIMNMMHPNLNNTLVKSAREETYPAYPADLHAQPMV